MHSKIQKSTNESKSDLKWIFTNDFIQIWIAAYTDYIWKAVRISEIFLLYSSFSFAFTAYIGPRVAKTILSEKVLVPQLSDQ